MGGPAYRAGRPEGPADTNALGARPDSVKAQFQRGQAYFKLGDDANARKDLEAFIKNAPASLGFAKQQATQLLLDIASKPRPTKK